MQRLRQQLNEREYTISVMLELQADSMPGLGTPCTKKKQILEPGDIEEALNAANAIGDDRLQKNTGTRSTRCIYTWHFCSAYVLVQKRIETGDIRQGDTFNASDLQ